MTKHVILEMLQEFGEIAHWTQTPALDVGNRACPPIITWRYKHPSGHVADFFRRAVGAYRGAIVWEFSATQQTWVLMPAQDQ